MRAQRVLREYAEVCVCVCLCVCSRQMDLFITYEDDDSNATRRNKTANTNNQTVSNLFRQCGFQKAPAQKGVQNCHSFEQRAAPRAHCDAGFLLEC